MTEFFYIKRVEQEGEEFLFLGPSASQLFPGSWSHNKAPHMFISRRHAFVAYEDFKMQMRAAGKPTALFQIHKVDL